MQKNVAKGIVAGLAAGVAGAWTMEQFQELWSKFAHAAPPTDSRDPATVQAARTFSKLVLRRDIDEDHKQRAGEIAHYAVGAASGAAYGGAAEKSEKVSAGFGSLFGAGLFLVNDETIVPAVGWSKPPTAYPLSTHLFALASHVVYGVSTEFFRRALRRVM